MLLKTFCSTIKSGFILVRFWTSVLHICHAVIWTIKEYGAINFYYCAFVPEKYMEHSKIIIFQVKALNFSRVRLL